MTPSPPLLYPRPAPRCHSELVALTLTGRPSDAYGATKGSCPREAVDGERCYYHRKIEEGLIT